MLKIVVKTIEYDKLVEKVNPIKTTDTSKFVKKVNMTQRLVKLKKKSLIMIIVISILLQKYFIRLMQKILHRD